jgi:uncharacterized protein (UPF0548 family)
MWSIQKPSIKELTEFLEVQAKQDFIYQPVGASAETFPKGYKHDRNFAELGTGEAVYRAAVAGLMEWKMFPTWAEVYPESDVPEKGMNLGLCFHLAGIYWKSAGRIVYEVSESGGAVKARAGFAYGTLPGHVEMGEERFTIAWLPDDRVVYELQAFSKPRYWMARLAFPLARIWQRKFVRESQQALKDHVEQAIRA